ncbi:hypothetical protein [Muriicola jejuensis]|uniref:hypothetical protein n=1 Tax=Muriicola jejuensis TaxID=504488 RepID=UPI0024B6A206|nr:hypothetical protein [Muriicola jejuensis]
MIEFLSRYSSLHLFRSLSSPKALLYRNSAVLDNNLLTISDIMFGIPLVTSFRGAGGVAMWECIKVSLSTDSNGLLPDSIS